MKTKIHAYYLDVSKPADAETYAAMCTQLKGKGLKVFDTISIPGEISSKYRADIAALDDTFIELETKFLYDNQWNTACGLRVFDWCEGIYPNRSIKEGHWLEQTAEMRDIRHNTYVCGYCNAHYDKPGTCEKCLGSEYLELSHLHLLNLLPVDNSGSQSNAISPELQEKFEVAQKSAKKARVKKEGVKELEKCKRDIIHLSKKLASLEWLIARELDVTNIIYYSLANTWCVGWRRDLTEEERAEWAMQLKDAPFEWEFKS